MNLYYIPPDGFYIGNFEIKFYGLIMAFSMLLGIILASKLAKKRGIKSDDIILLALIALPCAVVGARLYYCFFYEYNYSFWELFDLRQGGLAIYGGVIGGLIGVVIFCAIKKNIKILGVICDICVPCLLLGQAIGRWGNFSIKRLMATWLRMKIYNGFHLLCGLKTNRLGIKLRFSMKAFGILSV